jgi:hypothetical protein
MLRTAEIDMADLVKASDINIFLSDAAWAICSAYNTVLKASSVASIFGQDTIFHILFIADWKKIGEQRKGLTDLNTAQENKGRIDYDYQVGQKVLVRNDGILCKAESRYLKVGGLAHLFAPFFFSGKHFPRFSAPVGNSLFQTSKNQTDKQQTASNFLTPWKFLPPMTPKF